MEAQRPDGLAHFGERADKLLGLLQLKQRQRSESRKAKPEVAGERVSLEEALLGQDLLLHALHTYRGDSADPLHGIQESPFPSPPTAPGNYLLDLTQVALLGLVLLLLRTVFIISVPLVPTHNVPVVGIPSSISGTARVSFYFLAAPPKAVVVVVEIHFNSKKNPKLGLWDINHHLNTYLFHDVVCCGLISGITGSDFFTVVLHQLLIFVGAKLQ